VKFSPNGQILSSKDSPNTKIESRTEINKNDYFFIERLSSLAIEKSSDIVKYQSEK
jgi:hypothetical protein